MKKELMLALGIGLALAGMAESYAPDFLEGKYDVRPSGIVPRWSGAVPGEWTFDFDAALANAHDEGKYTLLLFSAMWWCPHCQPLEARVLEKEDFRSFVEEKGFYLTVVDFPYRDGLRNWCWLWDLAYREANGIGDWTPEQVSDELIRRFEFQDSWTKNGALTTNRNVLVEIEDGVTNLVGRTDVPETVYHRVGYPTIIVVGPDGTEAGRFSFNKSIAESEAIDYVVGNVRSILKAANGSSLSDDPGAGGFLGMAAAQYTGWLEDDETGVAAGTFTIKTGKVNKKTGLVKVTASIQPMGGKKVSLSGTVATPCTNAVIELMKKNTAVQASVTLGANGLAGVFTDAGRKLYAMQGARNVFAAKDADAKARAAALKTGFWTLAITNGVAVGAGSAFADGVGGLSVTVKSKGKVKVTGRLGDGMKMNASAQGVMGDDGMFAVPVMAALYSKKGGLSFVLRFQKGVLKSVESVSAWIAAGKNPFTSSCGVKHGTGAGASVPSEETMRIELDDLNLANLGIVNDALSVEFTPVRTKWKGLGKTDMTQTPFDFSLTYMPKTGLIKGTLTVSALDANGRKKKVKAKVYGAVVNGVGEGTAIFPDVGSSKIRITSACGGGGC